MAHPHREAVFGIGLRPARDTSCGPAPTGCARAASPAARPARPVRPCRRSAAHSPSASRRTLPRRRRSGTRGITSGVAQHHVVAALGFQRHRSPSAAASGLECAPVAMTAASAATSPARCRTARRLAAIEREAGRARRNKRAAVALHLHRPVAATRPPGFAGNGRCPAPAWPRMIVARQVRIELAQFVGVNSSPLRCRCARRMSQAQRVRRPSGLASDRRSGCRCARPDRSAPASRASSHQRYRDTVRAASSARAPAPRSRSGVAGADQADQPRRQTPADSSSGCAAAPADPSGIAECASGPGIATGTTEDGLKQPALPNEAPSPGGCPDRSAYARGRRAAASSRWPCRPCRRRSPRLSSSLSMASHSCCGH